MGMPMAIKMSRSSPMLDAICIPAHVIAGVSSALLVDQFGGLANNWLSATGGLSPAATTYSGQYAYLHWSAQAFATAQVLPIAMVILWTAAFRPRYALLHLFAGLAMSVSACLAVLVTMHRSGLLGFVYRLDDTVLRLTPFAVAGVAYVAVARLVFLRRLGPFRKQSREVHPLCLKCSYDLTGNVSGRCPECGATMERPASGVEVPAGGVGTGD